MTNGWVNPRDDGRYDQFTDTVSDSNVRVDFVWGNIPMQPNDDRVHDGSPTLDPDLDSHIIATSGYEGFPAFIQGGIYDDTVANVAVPDLAEMTLQQADDALGVLALSSNYQTTTVGATSGNDGTVKSQTPAAGTLLNVGDEVTFTTYHYVVVAHPISGFNKTVTDEGWTLGVGDAIMYLEGRTVKPTTGDVIRVSGSSESDYNYGFNVLGVVNNDSYNTGGTAVWVSPFEHALTANTSSGGTWAPYN